MKYISVRNANNNNLKDVRIDIPLRQYVVFVGKSGSGKSTLAADVIVGGALVNSPNVKVPVQPALFRQRVEVPKNADTVRQYLSGNTRGGTTVLNFLLNSKTVDNAALISEVAKTIGIGGIKLNSSVSGLSLTEYNKLRFIKLLIQTKSTILVEDELAAGMSFFEAEALSVALKLLVDNGYSILAIEHSLPLIAKADFVVEMGPDAGTRGGKVMFCGSLEEYKSTDSWKKTVTALNKTLPAVKPNRRYLKICSIDYHGLQIPELTFPSSCVVNIIGASGTGKSTLLDIVFRSFDKSVNAWKNRDGINGEIGGKSYVRRPYLIDQSPIGNNAMSSPATYTKIMDILRDLYAQTALSNNLKYTSADFSYNSTGKCEACGGRGVVEISTESDTLFDTCRICKGKRFRKDLDKVLVEGLTIGDVLKSPCGDLSSKFVTRKTLRSKIGFISDVGLSYLTLGQPSTSLSGGESQRIKITRELAKKLGDRCLFILDTPSKGLHTLDFAYVLNMLRRLTNKNNSVLICDNNPYFIKNSDWVVFLDNGKIIYEGIPGSLPIKIKNKLGIGVKF